MKKIAIFCGGKKGIPHKYISAAKKFVQALVDANMSIIYGGGNAGIMGAIADHMIQLNGNIIGIMPEFLVNRECAHSKLTNLHIVDSMQARKKLIFDLADGFVMLPGGVGTMDEFFEAVTDAQIGLHEKPCGILNVENYYEHINLFLEYGIKEGFIDKQSREQIIIEDNPVELIDKFIHYKIPNEYKKSALRLNKLQPVTE